MNSLLIRTIVRMTGKAVKIFFSLLLSQSFIVPLKCQLTAPGKFFILDSRDTESLVNKDDMHLEQKYFECGMNAACSYVVASAIDAKSEETKEVSKEESVMSPKGATWKKIQEGLPSLTENGAIIEVKPRDNGYFQFKVGVPSGEYKIKIVHQSGYFTCSPLKHLSTLGCYLPGYDDGMWIVLTDTSDHILLPKENDNGVTLEANEKPSNTSFAIYNDIIELSHGQQLRFWYSEDLAYSSTGPENDNNGVVKFYAYAIKQ